MQIIIVNHRSSHHAKKSGYNKLIDHIQGAIPVPSGEMVLPYKLKKFVSRNTNQRAGMYDSNSVQKNWEVLTRLLSAPNMDRVIHYLNSERDIRLVAKFTSLYTKTKVCASFHYPPDLLPKVTPDTRYLKKINGAIAVGINQVDFMKNWLNLENVQYIPHGIDINFFVPDASLKKENTLLFVGQHLRDFDALNYAIPRLKEKIPSLQVNIVLRKDYAFNINSKEGVTVFSGIDDTTLRKLYQGASLLFLPLKDATACNAILESLACGLPVVSTDIEGNRGYLRNNSGLLIPQNDYNSLIDGTISLLKEQDLLRQMSLSAREVSMDYAWEKVAQDISAFYQKLIG